MKKLLIVMSAAAVLLTSCVSRNQGPVLKADEITAGKHTRVQTIYGTVEGYLDGAVYTFKGIQYGKAERFMPPQDPDSFEGITMCKLYGPKAPQSESLRWSGDTQRDYTFGNQFILEPMDEANCLVLNVWTKGINDGGKRPVFLWIHGGGYSTGSAHDLACYEGKALADKGDIVVVSLNHRLNSLGFTDMRGLGGKYSKSVNLGLQDIVKALEWINKNIGKFGGDPAEVTIAGQSGGGMKVSTLLAMPSAHGLFNKAVVQSGSVITQGDGEASKAFGIQLAKELGVKPDGNADFSKFTYEEINAASSRASRALSQQGIRGGNGGPVVDGEILPVQPFSPEAPAISKDVAMLIGTNFCEFNFDMSTRNNTTDEQARAQILERYGAENGQKMIEAFGRSYPHKQLRDLLVIDGNFRGSASQQIEIKARQGGAPAYYYMFAWEPANNVLGASHGMELPMMFNNVAIQREMTGSSPEAYAIEEVVSNAWIAFIKTGNPNAKGLPEWPAYNSETKACMVFDNVCEVVNDIDKDLLMPRAPRRN